MRGKQKRVKAGDIMNPGIITIEGGAKLLNVTREMADKKIGSIVVVNLSQELISIITETDILRAIQI